MKDLLAKNWLMVLLPLLLVAAAIVAFLLFGKSDPADSFQYGM